MEEQMYIVMAKVLDGEATAAEQQELEAWLRQDPANAAAFADAKAVWERAAAALASPQFDAAPAWEKVAARMQPAPQETAARPVAKVRAFPSWLKYGMAAAAAILIGLMVLQPGREERIAARDGNVTATLPDGSVITLRKGSTLAYPKTFAARERHVSLTGEAFFEVARNEAQPFVIDAQSVSVRVLGTTFNVQCTDTTAAVTVATGKVQVTDGHKAGSLVLLTAGEAARYAAGVLEEAADAGDFLYWKTGELAFRNQPLSAVVAAIARAKNTSITLDAAMTATQQQQPITARFSGESLEDMLTELCLITNCRWQKAGNGYRISPR